MIFSIKIYEKWFYYKNALEMIFYYKNALDNDFTIKIHWTMILL